MKHVVTVEIVVEGDESISPEEAIQAARNHFGYGYDGHKPVVVYTVPRKYNQEAKKSEGPEVTTQMIRLGVNI